MKTIIHDIQDKMIFELNKKFEDLIIEGLQLKGFEFDNKSDLEKFIIKNCRCDDYSDKKEKIFYVNNIPFFLHNYEIQIDFDDKLNLKANYGTYAYL